MRLSHDVRRSFADENAGSHRISTCDLRHDGSIRHAQLQPDIFAAENLTLDERFADNPAVKQDPRFRFYAGAPVVDGDGFALGSLCILDRKPRTLNENEAEVLRSLGYLTSEAVQARTLKGRLREI